MNELTKLTKTELMCHYSDHEKQMRDVIDTLENMLYNDVTHHIWYKLEAERLLEDIRSGLNGTAKT